MHCQLGCRVCARAGPLPEYYHVRSNGIAIAEPIHASIGYYIKLMFTDLDNLISRGVGWGLREAHFVTGMAGKRIVFREIKKREMVVLVCIQQMRQFATWQMRLAVYLALGVGTTLGQFKCTGGWFTGWAESRTRRKSRTFCCKRKKKKSAEWSLQTFLGFLNTILINSNLSLKFQGWFRGIKGTNGDRPQKICK